MLNKGGHTAQAGTYWNVVNGNRVDLEREGTLPGDGGTRYIKAPAAAILAAAPALGLIYAVFLPFIGIVMALTLIGKKLMNALSNVTAGSVSFGWRPVEAYLAGAKRKKEAREKKSDRAPGKK